jgi:hypothetical protein
MATPGGRTLTTELQIGGRGQRDRYSDRRTGTTGTPERRIRTTASPGGITLTTGTPGRKTRTTVKPGWRTGTRGTPGRNDRDISTSR